MGAIHFFVVGCYIPPSDLETLTDVNKAWQACPAGARPILVEDLNFNFRALRTERKERIAEQVNVMDLVDMSRHFCQRLGKRLWGRWTWQMRREGRWISSQCNYFFGREINQQRFQCVSIWMPRYYSDHCTLVADIYAEAGGELKWYQWRVQQFPISLLCGLQKQLDAEYKELQQDVVCPPLRERPANSWITTETWKLVNHCTMLHT
jgi:hypothetical protein